MTRGLLETWEQEYSGSLGLHVFPFGFDLLGFLGRILIFSSRLGFVIILVLFLRLLVLRRFLSLPLWGTSTKITDSPSPWRAWSWTCVIFAFFASCSSYPSWLCPCPFCSSQKKTLLTPNSQKSCRFHQPPHTGVA